jgi:XTP/dITP diphosphohydrolase
VDSSVIRSAPLKISVATSNQGKLLEFQRLASGADLGFYPVPHFSELPAFEENAPTFAENSAGKALHYSAYTGTLLIADDSGLVVPALGGAPGVHSARYAGPNASSESRINTLLKEMRGLEAPERTARFVCVLTLAHAGRAIAVFSASVEGAISDEPAGLKGFGYDPIFVPEGYSSTFAQMRGDEKDQLSHRARAFRKLIDFLANDEFRHPD